MFEYHEYEFPPHALSSESRSGTILRINLATGPQRDRQLQCAAAFCSTPGTQWLDGSGELHVGALHQRSDESRTRRGGLQLHHCAQPLIESRQLSNSGPKTELQFVDGVSNTEIQRSGAANSGERLARVG